jgi:hypothetical protein
MIKIKLECWWTDSGSLINRFIKQFVFDQNDFEFVTSNPDYTIVFGRTNWDLIETPKERTFYFSQEPLWSPNEPKNNIHNYCSKIFVSDKREYPDIEEYIETLLPMFYAGRGDIDSREEWDWSKTLLNKSYNKTKPISIIVRKDYSTHYNHLSNPETSNVNYILRTDLGIKLSENKLIDIFGTYWESNGENIKGEIWNKHIGVDDYQFSVGCENSIQKNYISEKFWDIVLTDGIPIYLGCSNIDEYVPENCFISLNGLTLDEMVIKINDIIDNNDKYYNLMIENIHKLKNDFYQNPTFNLWEKIKLTIKENEN